MTTPHPQLDSPPPDVAQLQAEAETLRAALAESEESRYRATEAALHLQARIAELEAERETARQVAATLYRADAAAQRAAAAFYRYIMATAAMKAHMDSCRRCLQDYICEEWEKLEEQNNAAFAAAMEAAKDFKP